MKKQVPLTLLFLSLFLSVSASYKIGEEKPAKVTTATNSTSMKAVKKFQFPPKGTTLENPEVAALKALSDQYGVPVDRLQYFRGLHHGYEEIVPALIVAREAQVEAGRILQMRMENQSWKQIAESFDMDLKPLNDEVLTVLTPLRKKLPKEALMERPQTRQ